MPPRTRVALLLANLGVAAALLPAPAQGPLPAGLTREVVPCGPALLLPTDTALPRKLQAARDYSRAARWDEAVAILQALLDGDEDAFLPAASRGEGKSATSWVSARAEAERLVAAMPRPGREVYEQVIGPRAQARLTAARGEPAQVADVARRYLHTRAGAEAAVRLGSLHLDRGRFDLAAAHFERALRSMALDRPDALTLTQLALARRGAGNEEKAEAIWKRLADEGVEEVRVGERTIALEDLERQSRRGGPPAEERLPALSPALAWYVPTAEETTTRAWIDEAVRRAQGPTRDPFHAPEATQPVLSSFFPLAVDGKLVARTHRGIRAVDAASGATLWEASSPWALDAILHEPAEHAHVGLWVESYLGAHPAALLDNSLLGTLSTDGLRVYAVDDLPWPPYPSNYATFASRATLGGEFPSSSELTDALHHNRLLALDLTTGRVVWEAGGRARAAGGPNAFLRGAFFLGPPLALAGKLYVAVQKGFDLVLVCLEPSDGRLVWKQTLAAYKAPLAKDGGRRLRAVTLTHGDGLLICPTHAGGVLAFDLAAHRLAWAYAYREEPPPPPPDPFMGRRRAPAFRALLVTEPPHLKSEWRVAPPAVTAGRVVVSPTDSPDLLCLDLHEGTLHWKAGRTEGGPIGDLFLAGVHAGRAVLVGQKGTAALDLTEGRRVWSCETAAPVGRGVIVGRFYHLPVQQHRAEVLGIDLEQGTITRREPVEPDALGNLTFHRGALLSQTAEQLGAYTAEKKGP